MYSTLPVVVLFIMRVRSATPSWRERCSIGRDYYQATPLHNACRAGDIETLGYSLRMEQIYTPRIDAVTSPGIRC